MYCPSRPSTRVLIVLALTAGSVAQAATPSARCPQVLQALGAQLADASCVDSPDLTTNNPQTTPADNVLPGLPPFAFTPTSDRAVLVDTVSVPPVKTPINAAVPGVQISARIASDPKGQARFLLRLPANWNGRLVVAGASAQRSEYNGDFAWSDYVVQKGYAYASQNKGTLNFSLAQPTDPLACRLNPASGTYVHFYDDESGQSFTRWTTYMIEAARLAHAGVKAAYGQGPRYTYAVGTSNGGYQVRRALEEAPQLFDGGVDSEGTYVNPSAPNLLVDLPRAVLNLRDHVSGGLDANSTAAKNIRSAGYPPDIPASSAGSPSFWQRHDSSYWELTLCQWQKRLDPAYDTYTSGLATYDYYGRLAASSVGQEVDKITTTGHIKRPLITVVGTMDALLPIDHHARAYARAVQAVRDEDEPDDGRSRAYGRHRPAYRLYEVQNGNHIESYKAFYPQLEYLLPHTQRAFDLMVAHVEHGVALPPDQCIPRGGAIAVTPAQAGHCAAYLAP